MRRKKHIWIAAVGLVAAGAAWAQPQAPAQPVPLGSADMLKKANEYMATMQQGANTVRRQLSKAREERDVVKAACLDDKLTQIDVAKTSAEDRRNTLRVAVASNDTERAQHEFNVVDVLRKQVIGLVTEANECIGEEIGRLGESEVTVEVDPNIPRTDTAQVPVTQVISSPPVLSSPIL